MSIIKSFSVGNGDMFYINHNSNNFTIIDCYMNDENKMRIVDELKTINKNKKIMRFISTHPDEDHLRGLKYLDENLEIKNFYCVENKAIKTDEETEDFKYYCTLRDSEKAYYVYQGCLRKWMNLGDDEIGCAGINFKWPNLSNDDFKDALSKVANGSGFNNISPIFTYSVENGVVSMWMGDMEKDFLDKIKDEIEWSKVNILFAPHHGRDSAKVPNDILKKINPDIIVIGEADSDVLNYYQGYNTITQNSAKDIVFNCKKNYIHVYVSDNQYNKPTYLVNKYLNDNKYGNYIGSLKIRGGK